MIRPDGLPLLSRMLRTPRYRRGRTKGYGLYPWLASGFTPRELKKVSLLTGTTPVLFRSGDGAVLSCSPKAELAARTKPSGNALSNARKWIRPLRSKDIGALNGSRSDSAVADIRSFSRIC